MFASLNMPVRQLISGLGADAVAAGLARTAVRA
jgi:hypothetical protein